MVSPETELHLAYTAVTNRPRFYRHGWQCGRGLRACQNPIRYRCHYLYGVEIQSQFKPGIVHMSRMVHGYPSSLGPHDEHYHHFLLASALTIRFTAYVGTSREGHRSNHQRRPRKPRSCQSPPSRSQRPRKCEVCRRVLCSARTKTRRPME